MPNVTPTITASAATRARTNSATFAIRHANPCPAAVSADLQRCLTMGNSMSPIRALAQGAFRERSIMHGLRRPRRIFGLLSLCVVVAAASGKRWDPISDYLAGREVEPP